MEDLKFNAKKIEAIYAKTKKFAEQTGARGNIKIDIDMQRKHTRKDLEAVLQKIHPSGGGFRLTFNDAGIVVTEDLNLHFVIQKEKY